MNIPPICALLVIVALLIIVVRAVRNATPPTPKRGDMGGSQQHRGYDGH